MRRLLLDTSAILFFSQRSKDLSDEAYDLLEDPTSNLWFSPVTAGELACLQERNRLNLGEPWKHWLRRLQHDNNWKPLDVSYEIVEEAYSLPPPIHRDPADRILIASARVHDLELVTTDLEILKYPHVRTIS